MRYLSSRYPKQLDKILSRFVRSKMRFIYFLAYLLFLLSRLVRAEVFATCENITLEWELTSFSQGNLLVRKEPETLVKFRFLAISY